MAENKDREIVTVRLSRAGRDRLEELKWSWRVSRSEIIRDALAFALARPEEFKAFMERKVEE